MIDIQIQPTGLNSAVDNQREPAPVSFQSHGASNLTPTQRRIHEEHKLRRARFFNAALRTEKPRPLPGSAEFIGPIKPKAPPLPIPTSARIAFIQRSIARQHLIDVEDMLGPSRKGPLILPRHLAMYFTKRFTKASLPAIGRKFGGRDHTTVLHAVRKIERWLSISADFQEEIAAQVAYFEQAFVVEVP